MIDDVDVAATTAMAERLVKLFDRFDALKDPKTLAVLEEFRELVDELEAAEKEGRYLDAAHACEELRDVFRGREMTIVAGRFNDKAQAYRYESRIRKRAKTRREKRGR